MLSFILALLPVLSNDVIEILFKVFHKNTEGDTKKALIPK